MKSSHNDFPLAAQNQNFQVSPEMDLSILSLERQSTVSLLCLKHIQEKPNRYFLSHLLGRTQEQIVDQNTFTWEAVLRWDDRKFRFEEENKWENISLLHDHVSLYSLDNIPGTKLLSSSAEFYPLRALVFVHWNGQCNFLGKILYHSMKRDKSVNWNCTCSLSSLWSWVLDLGGGLDALTM